MRGHLAPAGTWIVGRADSLQEHFIRRGPECQAQGTVPIIRKEPVVAWLKSHASGNQHRFMPSPGDLEEYLLLALKHDLPVVEAAGGIHQPIDVNELLAGEAFVGLV